MLAAENVSCEIGCEQRNRVEDELACFVRVANRLFDKRRIAGKRRNQSLPGAAFVGGLELRLRRNVHSGVHAVANAGEDSLLLAVYLHRELRMGQIHGVLRLAERLAIVSLWSAVIVQFGHFSAHVRRRRDDALALQRAAFQRERHVLLNRVPIAFIENLPHFRQNRLLEVLCEGDRFERDLPVDHVGLEILHDQIGAMLGDLLGEILADKRFRVETRVVLGRPLRYRRYSLAHVFDYLLFTERLGKLPLGEGVEAISGAVAFFGQIRHRPLCRIYELACEIGKRLVGYRVAVAYLGSLLDLAVHHRHRLPKRGYYLFYASDHSAFCAQIGHERFRGLLRLADFLLETVEGEFVSRHVGEQVVQLRQSRLRITQHRFLIG